MVAWFDHHLKGANNGAERQPNVQYFNMGACGEPGAPGNDPSPRLRPQKPVQKPFTGAQGIFAA
jgi:hypothetical protein